MADHDDIRDQIARKATSDSGFAIAYALLALTSEVADLRRGLVGSYQGPGVLEEGSARLSISIEAVAGSLRDIAASID